MPQHIHAFLWAGKEWPSPKDRKNPLLPTPPIYPAQWLVKPRELHRRRFDTPRGTISWLNDILINHCPANIDNGSFFDILNSASRQMSTGRDVSTSYVASDGLWVYPALIRCPRPKWPCPTRLWEP